MTGLYDSIYKSTSTRITENFTEGPKNMKNISFQYFFDRREVTQK